MQRGGASSPLTIVVVRCCWHANWFLMDTVKVGGERLVLRRWFFNLNARTSHNLVRLSRSWSSSLTCVAVLSIHPTWDGVVNLAEQFTRSTHTLNCTMITPCAWSDRDPWQAVHGVILNLNGAGGRGLLIALACVEAHLVEMCNLIMTYLVKSSENGSWQIYLIICY